MVLLQWGRDFNVAESGTPATWPSGGSPLQWGRDFNVAERWRRQASTMRDGPGFNGAATLTSRRVRHVDDQVTTGTMLQWGRDFNVAESNAI